VAESTAIELHDSLLERIERVGDSIVAIFTAYVHRSAGEPGRDAGSGWTQAAQMTLLFARGAASDDPLEIADGSIVTTSGAYANVIPVPFRAEGATRLELHGSRGEAVTIEAEGIAVELVGDATFVEAFPGTGGI
jgi:hypothetical protein